MFGGLSNYLRPQNSSLVLALEVDGELVAVSKYEVLKAEIVLFSFLQEEVMRCRSN